MVPDKCDDEANYLLASIVESSNDAIIGKTLDGVITSWNKGAEEIYGYRADEVIGKPINILVPPGYHDDTLQIMEKIRRGERVVRYETVRVRKDGKEIYVSLTVSPIKDEKGSIFGASTIARDISLRKSQEAALRASEEKYRRIVDLSEEGIFVLDENDTATFANKKLAELLGYSIGEIVGKNITAFMDEEDKGCIERVKRKHLEGHVIQFDFRFRRKDGSHIWTIVPTSPIFDKEHHYVGALYMISDITERKLVEEDRKRLLHDLRERVKELTALYGVYGIIQKGRSVQEVLQEITDILPSAWQYPEVTAARIIFDGREFKTPNFLETPWKQRADFHTADGKHGAIEVYYLEEMRDEVEGPFLAEERDLIDSLAETVRIYLDKWYAEKALTDAKAQAELYMDLMGHDINNLNQIALGYLELAIDVVKDDEVKEIIKKPLDAIQNSSKLIENVRKLQRVKTGGLKIEAIDLGGLLAELKDQYLNVPGKDVAIDYAPGRNCYVRANGLLRDVFSNLIGNAIKHSGPSKSVRIGLGLDRVKEDGRDYCKVIVEDHGPGIPDVQKEKMFGRFRKENVKAGGMGLGLYLVKSLVDDFHGTVRVEDRVPGDHTKGARFVVMLPAVEK